MQPGDNTRPHARLPPIILGMDVVGLFLLTCYSLSVPYKPGTGRRPVDWCRNEMSVLYVPYRCTGSDLARVILER